jgi:NAD(P)-dependent dehydrogenase (short-subunit alcohol dehydrogenase family)
MPNALVTGANRGIGLELCKQLKDKGYDVIAVCRSSSKELDALGVRVESGIDVTAGGEDLARRVAGVPLDLLIQNAGILRNESLEDLDVDSIRQQIEVNALAPLRVTQALLPNLKRGAKLALITSRMGSIADNGSGGYYGYRMSKAALNIAGVSLARDLSPRGIAVVLLHPGFVRTGMTGHQGAVEPDVAASDLLKRIDELTPATSGRFFHASGEELPW